MLKRLMNLNAKGTAMPGLVLLAGFGITAAAVYFMVAPRVGDITNFPSYALGRIGMKQANWGGAWFEGAYGRDRAIPLADQHYLGSNDPRKRVTVA